MKGPVRPFIGLLYPDNLFHQMVRQEGLLVDPRGVPHKTQNGLRGPLRVMNLNPLFFQPDSKKPNVFLSDPRFNSNNHGNHLLKIGNRVVQKLKFLNNNRLKIKKGGSPAISLPWSLPGLQGYGVYFT
jgi:hypothetical protein